MFDFVKVSKGSRLCQEVFALRYKVYCDEWGFERAEDHAGGLETDEYDDHAVHFAAIRKDNGQLIGTVRIIFNSEHGFPVEHHSTIEMDLARLDRNRMGEISRLAVSKEYRKRLSDKIMFDGHELTEETENRYAAERRKTDHDIVLGLYRCVYRESCDRGLTHLLAVMADGLYLLLRRTGIVFNKIGPPVEYHGMRTPYLCDIDLTLQRFAQKNPSLFNHFISSSL